MKIKLSPSRFYLSNIIFYICLLSSPLSAATQPLLSQQPQQYKSLQFNLIEYKPQEEYKNTKWFNAVKQGNLNEAKLLKKRGEDINATDEEGYNALHIACRNSDNVAMVTWLLDVCNIDIETKEKYQRTPFLCAAEKGQLTIAKRLKERGANIHAKDKWERNALHYACLFSDSVEMTTWLLDECKMGLETKGFNKRTPFLSAANQGNLVIAKLLKERGANINAKDKDGNNALHMACLWSESKEMVTWLLDECKLGIKTKGYEQKTPFLCAAKGGQLGMAKLLKKRGADIHAKDKNGDNALHWACWSSGSTEMVTWLVDVCKIDKEAKGWKQQTLFLCAAKRGHLEIAKLLRKRGANIHAKDKDGNNALDLAKYIGKKNKKMIDYLKSQSQIKTGRRFNFWSRWF